MKTFFKNLCIIALIYMISIIITDFLFDMFNLNLKWIYCLWFILGEVAYFLINYDYYIKNKEDK